MILYHYTCNHGNSAFIRKPLAMPIAMHTPSVAARMPSEWRCMGDLVWFTDLDHPFRDALGLTSYDLPDCDRTRYRWQVLGMEGIQAWLVSDYRARYPQLRALERVAGALPRHWFVSLGPVPVIQPAHD